MDFRDELRDYILSCIPGSKLVSGGREIVTRCIFCGDSINKSHSHLYIGLGYDNKPLMYNCFKCGEGGILTASVMHELGLVDYSILEKLTHYNKQQSSDPKNRYTLRNNAEIYYMSNYFIKDCDVSYKKRDYINSRLGLQLSFNELLNNKIVVNLFDLFQYNHINFNPNDKFLNELNENFVGFLSEDNNFVIERNIDSGLDLRYYNYNIHGKLNKNRRYYILPCQINLIDQRPINVHIAEGPFDILSIKYNVIGNSSDGRDLFIAMCGKAYRNIVLHLLTDMGLSNMNIHFYVDLDVSDNEIMYISRQLYPFNMDIYIHRNGYINNGKQEKDYGVSKEFIIDTIQQINKRK